MPGFHMFNLSCKSPSGADAAKRGAFIRGWGADDTVRLDFYSAKGKE
jgi:hypothetical protein